MHDQDRDAIPDVGERLTAQDRLDQDRLAALLRELVTDRYRDEMDASAIEAHVQEMTRRVTAQIATLGQDQYRRVQPARSRPQSG